MKKIIRYLAFGVLACFGMISILATAADPVPVNVELISENNYSSVYGPIPVYVCPNDQVLMKVSLWGTRDVAMSGVPKQHTIPELNSRIFTHHETLEVTVLDAVDLVVLQPDEYKGLRAEIQMLPDDICNDFPLRITGRYMGELSQVLHPSVEGLTSYLKLEWREDGLYGFFDRKGVKCQVDSSNDSISCVEPEGYDPFTLNATFTKLGLIGSYKGITTVSDGVRYSFEGTFEFEKIEAVLEVLY